MVHTACRPQYPVRCPLGPCRVSIVPPTALHSVGTYFPLYLVHTRVPVCPVTPLAKPALTGPVGFVGVGRFF